MKKDPFMDGAQLTETLMVSISKAHMQIHGYVTIVGYRVRFKDMNIRR